MERKAQCVDLLLLDHNDGDRQLCTHSGFQILLIGVVTVCGRNSFASINLSGWRLNCEKCAKTCHICHPDSRGSRGTDVSNQIKYAACVTVKNQKNIIWKRNVWITGLAAIVSTRNTEIKHIYINR